MKRTLALLLLLFCLPMAKSRMIHRIRCQNPDYTYEQLCCLSDAQLQSIFWSNR